MQIRIPNPKADTAPEWSKYLVAIQSDKMNLARKAASKKGVDYYNGKQLPYLIQDMASRLSAQTVAAVS